MDRRSANAIMDSNLAMNDHPSKGSKAAGLEEARLRQHAIGVKLRQIFDEVVSEPVPDEFLDILRQADADKADRA